MINPIHAYSSNIQQSDSFFIIAGVFLAAIMNLYSKVVYTDVQSIQPKKNQNITVALKFSLFSGLY